MALSVTFNDFNFGSLDRAARDFADGRVCIFRNFITQNAADILYQLVFTDNSEHLWRRDILMPQSGYTSRHMSTISGNVLNTVPAIKALHMDPALMVTLDTVTGATAAGDRVVTYADTLENIVGTRLSDVGDTHGRHVDDPALALIICLRAPLPGQGGEVEYEKRNPQGGVTLERFHLNAGDAYVMETSAVAHAVLPLTVASERAILNLTYDYGSRNSEPNGSADLLFR